MTSGSIQCGIAVLVIVLLWDASLSEASLTGSKTAGSNLCFMSGTGILPAKIMSLPQRLQAIPESRRRSIFGGMHAAVRKEGRGELQGNKILNAAKAATFSLFLMGAALLPLPKSASAGWGRGSNVAAPAGVLNEQTPSGTVESQTDQNNGLMMEADGTLNRPQKKKSSLPIAQIGLAAGASVVTFGSMTAIAIKKEKQACLEDRQSLENDLSRLNSFKDEFLDGKVSDRSLFSSFKKATKQTTDEDEFDKNMREALAEEEEKKNPKKKSSSGKGSGTQLDRPGDVKASDSAEDEVIEEDHTPADIDPAVRAMLEKMMGGGGGSGNDKQ